jgi:hypothetical protein
MMLRGGFVIMQIDREVSGKVVGNIGKVPKTLETFWTLSELYRQKNYAKVLIN